jgi:alkylation response protein AidB-like acyl-CoA dehydrogenase
MLRQQAAKLDFVAPPIPEEYGGARIDQISNPVVTEKLCGLTRVLVGPSLPLISE